MSKPAILTVDDDPMVSAAISRDLRMHYGAEQRHGGAISIDSRPGETVLRVRLPVRPPKP